MAKSFKVLTLAIGLMVAPPLLLAPGFVQPARADMADAAGELAYWNRIKNSSNPAEFKAYLNSYPNGMFSDLALSKYHTLSGSSGASAPKAKQSKRAKARHVVVHKAHKHLVHKKRIKHKLRRASSTDPFANNPSHGSGGGSSGGGGWGH